MSKRAIIYSRVSTDEQAETGTSLDNQIAKGLAYAEAQGFDVVGVFSEDYTGKVLERPELTKARAMLRQGRANVFIAYKPDRLDRSEWGVNLLLLAQEFKALEIELHYAESKTQVDLDNPQEMLLQSIQGWQSGEDRKSIVKRLLDGRESRVATGSIMTFGNDPYGYKSRREGKINQLDVVDVEAEIVRTIFDWFVNDHKSLRGIATKLSELGIPTNADLGKCTKKSAKKRKVGEWARSSVAWILKNRTYIGEWSLNKSCNRDEITAEVPAIISDQVFEAAQKRLEENKKNDKGRKPTHDYLMGRRVWCGCRHKMRSIKSTSRRNGEKRRYYYYACSNRQKHSIKQCDMPNFRSEQVDERVWQWVEGVLLDPCILADGLQGYKDQTEEKADPVLRELELVSTQIAAQANELDEEIAKLDVLTSKRARAKVGVECERLENILDSLEAKQNELTGQLEVTSITDEQIKEIKEFAASLADGLADIRDDFESKREIIARLDVRATTLIIGGMKVVDVTAKVGDSKLPLLSSALYATVQKPQTFNISIRLIL